MTSGVKKPPDPGRAGLTYANILQAPRGSLIESREKEKTGSSWSTSKAKCISSDLKAAKTKISRGEASGLEETGHKATMEDVDQGVHKRGNSLRRFQADEKRVDGVGNSKAVSAVCKDRRDFHLDRDQGLAYETERASHVDSKKQIRSNKQSDFRNGNCQRLERDLTDENVYSTPLADSGVLRCIDPDALGCDEEQRESSKTGTTSPINGFARPFSPTERGPGLERKYRERVANSTKERVAGDLSNVLDFRFGGDTPGAGSFSVKGTTDGDKFPPRTGSALAAEEVLPDEELEILEGGSRASSEKSEEEDIFWGEYPEIEGAADFNTWAENSGLTESARVDALLFLNEFIIDANHCKLLDPQTVDRAIENWAEMHDINDLVKKDARRVVNSMIDIAKGVLTGDAQKPEAKMNLVENSQGKRDTENMHNVNPLFEESAYADENMDDAERGTSSRGGSGWKDKGHTSVENPSQPERFHSKVAIIDAEEMRKEERWLHLHALIGHMRGPRPPVSVIDDWLWNMWGKRGIIVTSYRFLRKGYLIFFLESEEMMSKVLSQGLWTLRNQPLYLEQWEPSFSPEKPRPTTAPVWVELPDLPLSLFKQAKTICAPLGKVLGQEKEGFFNPRGSPQVCVMIDLNEELTNNIRIEDAGGKLVLDQEVVYKNLPNSCFLCGLAGHRVKDCPVKKGKEGQKTVERRWVQKKVESDKALKKEENFQEKNDDKDVFKTPKKVVASPLKEKGVSIKNTKVNSNPFASLNIEGEDGEDCSMADEDEPTSPSQREKANKGKDGNMDEFIHSEEVMGDETLIKTRGFQFVFGSRNLESKVTHTAHQKTGTERKGNTASTAREGNPALNTEGELTAGESIGGKKGQADFTVFQDPLTDENMQGKGPSFSTEGKGGRKLQPSKVHNVVSKGKLTVQQSVSPKVPSSNVKQYKRRFSLAARKSLVSFLPSEKRLNTMNIPMGREETTDASGGEWEEDNASHGDKIQASLGNNEESMYMGREWEADVRKELKEEDTKLANFLANGVPSTQEGKVITHSVEVNEQADQPPTVLYE